MQNIIFLLFIFFSNLFSQTNEQWNKLLHHYQNENQITSKEFYLTENTMATPDEEFQEIILALNSQYGQEIACNFPARYQYIKSIKKSSKTYNLKDCQNLNEFVATFPQKKINLVFTSEYTNNPSSAFGHTMLLFSNDEKSLEIGDAVHFAAKTSRKDNFFKYSHKGFTGQYNGYFLREPFYKKIYDYNTLEQRYMYIYELNFSKERILQLIYHLYELRKATFKYYFLNGNCATQTTDLLNVITQNKRNTEQIYYLPIDTIKDFKKFITKNSRFTPLLIKLNLLLEKMSKEEKKIFHNSIQTNSDLDYTTPDIVKEAMVYYSTFYFRRYHRIYKNYNNIMEQSYLKTNLLDTTPNPLTRSQPTNIGIGLFSQDNSNYLSFHYRPLFIDIFDIQINQMQQSQINTFTFDVITNDKNTKLRKFDLANIKSFVNQSKYYTPISWSLYSGLNRENYSNDLKFVNELGVGRTNRFFNYFDTTLLLSLGFEDKKIYIKPSINLSKYLSKDAKIGINSYFKQFDTKNYNYSQVYLSKKKNNLLYQLKMTHDKSISKNNYLFSIKYNF